MLMLYSDKINNIDIIVERKAYNFFRSNTIVQCYTQPMISIVDVTELKFYALYKDEPMSYNDFIMCYYKQSLQFK